MASESRQAAGSRLRLTVAEAIARLRRASPPLDAIERLPVADASGRVTAAPLRARASVPPFHAAAMDGIAVRLAGMRGASPERPLELHRAPTAAPPEFVWIDTGSPLPPWADAVVMVEQVETVGNAGERPDRLRVRAPAEPWQHVRVAGEDVVEGELLLAAGHRLRPQDLGLLLAAGVVEVAVRARPVVAILPTGDELVEPGAERRPGETIESNSHMVAAWVREWGGEPLRLPIARDRPDELAAALDRAARSADAVCVIAGSSAGGRDYTARALATLGEVVAHGIDLVPGRPTILAELSPAAGRRARVAIGLPGYPVAAAMVSRELLGPLLAHLAGLPDAGFPSVRAIAAAPFDARPSLEELIRVEVGRVGETLIVRPLARGAGGLASLSRAAGLVRIRPGGAAIARGGEVVVELQKETAELLATVLASGLVEPMLDSLAEAIGARGHALRLAVRSLSPIAAIRDLAEGWVNLAAVACRPDDGALPAEVRAPACDPRGGIPPRSLRVVELGERVSGLLVAAGNPLSLRTPEDVEISGARLVPALKRGGARVVAPSLAMVAAPPTLDSLLAEAARQAAGAELEEMPPLAVGAAIAGGLADVAAGSASTAAGLGLGFVPLARERVVLLLRSDFAGSDLGRSLIEAAGSDAFRSALRRAEADRVASAARG